MAVVGNPNATNITPIQKAITSGYFYNTVSYLIDEMESPVLMYSGRVIGSPPEERGFIPHVQVKPDGIHPPVVQSLPTSASSEDGPVLRLDAYVEVLYAVSVPLPPAARTTRLILCIQASDGDQSTLAT